MRKLAAEPTSSTRKFTGRILRERVMSSKPDYNPELHKVYVNNDLVNNDDLDRKLGPLDIVKVV